MSSMKVIVKSTNQTNAEIIANDLLAAAQKHLANTTADWIKEQDIAGVIGLVSLDESSIQSLLSKAASKPLFPPGSQIGTSTDPEEKFLDGKKKRSKKKKPEGGKKKSSPKNYY